MSSHVLFFTLIPERLFIFSRHLSLLSESVSCDIRSSLVLDVHEWGLLFLQCAERRCFQQSALCEGTCFKDPAVNSLWGTRLSSTLSPVPDSEGQTFFFTVPSLFFVYRKKILCKENRQIHRNMKMQPYNTFRPKQYNSRGVLGTAYSICIILRDTKALVFFILCVLVSCSKLLYKSITNKYKISRVEVSFLKMITKITNKYK